MKILADLINLPNAGGREYDWRWTILNSMLSRLKNKGHEIFACTFNDETKKQCKFTQWNDEEVDFYIGHSPYGNPNKTKRYLRFKNKCVVYDHGWLYKSLVIDRNKLFGESYYRDKISNLIEEDYNEDKAENYRNQVINNVLTKRLQPSKTNIPNIPYIFIPFQVLLDASITHSSKVGMLEFVDKVIKFAKKNKVNVVAKLHPGMMGKFPAHGKSIINKFCDDKIKENSNFVVINAPIFDLMEKALFTACISSGSIIDNIITKTPVLAVGRTFFDKSGCIIHNENIEDGLNFMINKKYNIHSINDKQMKMLWWLRKTMIQEEYSVDKNIKLLEYHSGISFKQ